jgi:cupin fold WbuC family metalloprotein
MSKIGIPTITEQELKEGLLQAHISPRRRHPHILHKLGDEFNQVFNFMTRDSYMQPHLHPGEEKAEEIFLVKGRAAVIYFDNTGDVVNITHLKKEGVDSVRVPAFTWHTYVMLTEEVVTYETMLGKYDIATWKRSAAWAPAENMEVSAEYLNTLRKKVEV